MNDQTPSKQVPWNFVQLPREGTPFGVAAQAKDQQRADESELSELVTYRRDGFMWCRDCNLLVDGVGIPYGVRYSCEGCGKEREQYI
jgi:hypothetical protein